jgi:ribulose-phosphate 3-epimerase
VFEYLPLLSDNGLVLVMTVVPGKGGQPIRTDTFPKFGKITAMCKFLGIPSPVFQADGGINADNIGSLVKAGCNVFVVGSAIFNGSFCGDANGKTKIKQVKRKINP